MTGNPGYKTALLTGGNGNLGRHVADRLRASGIRTIKFDLPGTEPEKLEEGEDIITGDIRDRDLIEGIVAEHKPDIIYHLASLLSGSSEADLEIAWDINANASFNVLNLALKHQVKTVFFPSTIATYGTGLTDPLEEAAEQWPENMYGATKVAVERQGVYMKIKHGLDFRCLRIPLVISPFAPPSAVTAYPSRAFVEAFNGNAFTFPVSPDVGISSIFFEDVIDGIMQVTMTERENLHHHAYNLHSFFVSARMVAEKIRERLPAFQYDYQPIEAVERLMSEWPDVINDQSAREDWKWSPKFDFDKSATRMFEFLEC